jgi:hypothetical protein
MLSLPSYRELRLSCKNNGLRCFQLAESSAFRFLLRFAFLLLYLFTLTTDPTDLTEEDLIQ